MPSNKPPFDRATPLPPLPELNSDEVIERMKKALEITTDIELARMLGVSKTTVSSWRKRNVIPYHECVKVAYYARDYLDWIISGTEPKGYPGLYDGHIDHKLLSVMMYDVMSGKLPSLGNDDWKKAEFLAKWVTQQYNRYEAMMSEAVAQGRMTRDEYIDALRRAVETL